jgi:hypothetical protein
MAHNTASEVWADPAYRSQANEKDCQLRSRQQQDSNKRDCQPHINTGEDHS